MIHLKKTLCLLLAVMMLLALGVPAMAAGEIPVDAEHFPDQALRTYVTDYCDTNKDNKLSAAECEAVQCIDLFEMKITKVADMTGIPDGAVNIRLDGQKEFRQNSEHIQIVSKTDKDGIDIRIAPFTKSENVHIPVILSKSGFHDLVYNDFFVGEGEDVTIVAGCGIHNCGDCDSEHDGIHTFYIGKNAKVHYIEKHYGEGEGSGKRILNPQTIVRSRAWTIRSAIQSARPTARIPRCRSTKSS